ncbi:hypothetical protein ACFGVR_19665 [Mucilaginibacter sp. AW1-3]
MNFEIRFTPEAEDTFDAVITQLQQRWGDVFVSKFEAKVWSSLKTIEVTPTCTRLLMKKQVCENVYYIKIAQYSIPYTKTQF